MIKVKLFRLLKGTAFRPSIITANNCGFSR
jgi:hypothetical protein